MPYAAYTKNFQRSDGPYGGDVFAAHLREMEGEKWTLVTATHGNDGDGEPVMTFFWKK